MRRQFGIFLIRWLLNSFGLWVAVRLLGTGTGTTVDTEFQMFLLGGLIFSLINSILKPIVVIFALPAILITLGLFMLVVNGLMVYLSLQLTPGLEMTFLNSILTGMILSLLNYIVSSVFELNGRKRERYDS